MLSPSQTQVVTLRGCQSPGCYLQNVRNPRAMRICPSRMLRRETKGKELHIRKTLIRYMYMCIRSICIYPWLVKGPAKFRWICDVFLSRPTTCCGWWHMRKIVVVGCISLQLGCLTCSILHTRMLPIHGKQVVNNQKDSMLYLFNLFAACCNRLYNSSLFTAHPM